MIESKKIGKTYGRWDMKPKKSSRNHQKPIEKSWKRQHDAGNQIENSSARERSSIRASCFDVEEFSYMSMGLEREVQWFHYVFS